MANDLYLAELTVYDPSVSGTITLRYATGQGHVTGGAETPASTWYDGRIAQPCSVKRDIFRSGRTTGRTQIGYGDLVLYNADGALDVLLTYGFSSRVVQIRRGTVGAAYPSGFPSYFSGTMEQAEAVGDTIIVKVRDWQLYLDVPLQVNKYAGNNVLPAGLEGVAGDLLGKPKPLCFGTVQNVPAVPVNTSKLIYQVNDGAVTAISGVYDKGILLAEPPSTSVNAQFGANDPNTGHSLAYGNGTFVAVGQLGQVSTSTDGSAWTSRTSGFGANDVTAIVFGAGVFMIGGINKLLATSPDGITWTPRTLPAGWGATDDVNALAYGNGTFLAIGQTGVAATSTDGGANWTARTTGLGAINLGYAAYGAGAFVVTALTSASIALSVDLGLTWTTVAPDAAYAAGGQIAFGNGVFVGRNNTAGDIYRSFDGRIWTRHVVNPVVAGNITYTGGWFYNPIGADIRRSADGLLWSRFVNTTSATWLDIVASDDGLLLSAGTLAGAALHYVAAAAGDYASASALQDDTLAPAPGRYKTYLAGGYFRLGAPPAGLVTADVSEGTNAAARTAAQVFKRLLQRVNYTVSGTLSTDITALDTANSGVIGFWTNEERRLIDVLDEVASTPGAWWGVDNSGTYTIQQLTAPAGTPVLTITANDILQPLQRLASADDSRGLPSWRTVLRYARNYAVQDTDLAAGVTDARRTFLAREWREAISSDTTVLVAHQLAPQTAEDSLFYAAADATAEAKRRQVMRGLLRNRFQAVVELNDDTDGLDLGDVVALQHSRYSLSAGVNYRIIGLDPDVRAKRLTLTLWGPPDPISLMRLPLLVLSGTGTVT